jgi:hypothetical protein
MRRNYLLFILLFPVLSTGSFAHSFYVCQFSILKFGKSTVPVFIQGRKEGTPERGKFFFLPGLADLASSHTQLIDEITGAGFDFISVTYPSHEGSSGAGLGWYRVPKLIERAIIPVVSRMAKELGPNDFHFGGWSTGATLIEYILQNELLNELNIQPQSEILITPGLSVRPIVGRWENISRDTIAGPYSTFPAGDFKPQTPLVFPYLFAPSLLWESIILAENPIHHPLNVPTYIALANDLDAYVETRKVRRFARRLGEANYPVWVDQFDSPFHAIEWEPQIGTTLVSKVVRIMTTIADEGPQALGSMLGPTYRGRP